MTDQAPVVSLCGGRFRLVDLSIAISNATAGFEPNPHRITYYDHAHGAQTMNRLLGEGATFPGPLAAADEEVTLPTHCGTHVDAPYHYGPESAGAPAATVDELPLDWFFGDGFVIDMTHKRPGDSIEDHDVEGAIASIGHEVRAGEIALVRTDVSEHFHEPGYHRLHPGLRSSAVAWLVERGVRMIGIDAWGIDRPFPVMAEELRAGNPDQLWEAHLYGRERPYCQIEKLTNLRALPSTGFTIAAFPVKIERAGGAWARVVALVPE
ncbi:MAG TPA: cyclase family protein [Solirubrobacteraceae bacterium]|jgi:kynurenine formamidase|nr:cyclase family protein [Solirubrobacteraceae bacterium]